MDAILARNRVETLLCSAELHKKETCEAVTIVETPPMVIVGVVGYIKTPRGLRSLATVWAQHLDESVKRRFYKRFGQSKKKAFTKYAKTKYGEGDKKAVDSDLERIKKYCSVSTPPSIAFNTLVEKV